MIDINCPIIRKFSELPDGASFIIRGTAYSLENSYRKVERPGTNAYKNSIDGHGEYLWIDPETEVEVLW